MSIFDALNQSPSPSMGGTGGIGALAGNSIYPLSRMDKTQYATPTQLPTSADVISSDYDPKTDAYTGMPNARFAMGGIASIPRYDGEEGSQVETPKPWDPESGQVKLQKYEDPKDPFSPVKELVDYSIPKGQIQTFIPNTDVETGQVTNGGQLVLKDGSTLGVDGFGVVHAATPGRNDYTLNKEGYYQPTGPNLEWRGDLNMLTKKIGGVEVQVPGIYHKGGYQDPKGNLKVDANGVPVALAPNYLDSGFGKSGLADAAPYIAAAALGGGAALMAPGIAAGGFAGMVPASETLLGSMGALGATAVPTVSSAGAAPGYGINFGATGASGGINAGALGGSAGITAPSTAALQSAAGLGITEGSALAGTGAAAAKTAGMTTGQKLAAATLAAKALGGGSGGGTYAPAATTTTTQAPPQPSIASQQFNPAFTMPNMYAMNQAAPGAYYQPQTYRYYAQGGVADLGGYAAGGKLLKGPGDGMSDDIVANIAGKQPARLADGEFVVPADVVSHLGNGSTDAGAKHLYKMMDRIRQARTGNPKQGKRINPDKFLPKG